MVIFRKLLIFLLILTGGIIMTAILFFWLEIRTPLDNQGETGIFQIERGESAQSIARRLENEGIIRSAFYFRLYTRFELRHQSLKRGEYELSPRLSIREIADIIFQGKVNEVRITIPEGLTVKETEDILIASDLMKKGELTDFILKNSGAFQILKDRPISANLEGYLFPDTYNFYRDSSVDDLVKKMIDTLNTKVTSQVDLSKLKNKTFFQILTMASLIEKETKNDPDRTIVSGILWKRLQAGIPLQVDATLVYITGRKKIYETDKQIKSPYNTYLYRGLPKGPIANPGLAAINAALHPQDSPYWYYLNSPDGRTVYSITLEDHNRARSIYLR